MRESKSYGLSLARDLIRVEVAGVMYAFEIARIREILNPLLLIELPREHQFVLGVSDYRDEVVAVVDLRLLFGLEPTPVSRRTKWIVVESNYGLVAVVVDAVHEVFSSARNERRQVPVLDDRQRARGITGAFQHDAGLVFLLDADRVAAPAVHVRPEEVVFLPSEAP